MRTLIASALVIVIPSGCYGASKIQFLPGQEIFACPKKTSPAQPAAVCNANILVGGGQPQSGYTFTVTSGYTLPKGTFLMSLSGVVTMQSQNSALPAAGSTSKIHVTASDGSKSKAGVVTLKVQSASGICGCGVFQVLAGPLPPAIANQPYAVTLAVVGPPSNQSIRPNYSWKVRKGNVVPPGLVLDKARGVLRGSPHASASGHTYNFYVDVNETKSGQKAVSANFYTLQVN